MENEGYFKGETCNRDGCCGIIDEHEKEGCCSCHINPPCTYCATPAEYCPECGWDAEEEQRELLAEQAKQITPYVHIYKSDAQMFNELEEGKFGYVRLNSGRSFIRLKGKHPNMSSSEIYRELGLHENPNMPRMVAKNDKMFELTYFCD